jgi:hypothetical protein
MNIYLILIYKLVRIKIVNMNYYKNINLNHIYYYLQIIFSYPFYYPFFQLFGDPVISQLLSIKPLFSSKVYILHLIMQSCLRHP